MQIKTQFSKGLTNFTGHFLKQAWEDHENLVFSPFSILTALGVASAGSTDASETQKQLLSLSSFEDIQNLRREYFDVITKYKQLDSVNVATGIWINQDLELEEKFKKNMKYIFNSEIKKISSNSVNDINSFVEKETKGKIQKVIGE